MKSIFAWETFYVAYVVHLNKMVTLEKQLCRLDDPKQVQGKEEQGRV